MGRLVLVGTAGRWDDAPGPSLVFDLFASAPVQEWIYAVPPVRRVLQARMGQQFFSGQPVPAWFSEVSAALFDQRETRHTSREEMRRFTFDGPDPSPIERPILILHGDDDRIAPLVIAQDIAARAREARLLVWPGGSHALPATKPVWVAEQIAGFLTAR
jgi:pimeloyl-ACP methyl ester carboxylesterase